MSASLFFAFTQAFNVPLSHTHVKPSYLWAVASKQTPTPALCMTLFPCSFPGQITLLCKCSSRQPLAPSGLMMSILINICKQSLFSVDPWVSTLPQHYKQKQNKIPVTALSQGNSKLKEMRELLSIFFFPNENCGE